MSATFEDLRVLQSAEQIADGIWEQVAGWEPFAKDTVGSQLARAADSIGANIAESFGRFHFGEKLQFLYYARGSLFETKYWLNRTTKRQLMTDGLAQEYIEQLTSLARQLNTFTNSLKTQRKTIPSKKPSLRELSVMYVVAEEQNNVLGSAITLFTEDELNWLQSLPEY